MGADDDVARRAYEAAVEAVNLGKRILLLGLSLGWEPPNATSVSAYASVNLADYDVVIANVDVDGVAGTINKDQVARLITTGGDLVVIGAPTGADESFLPGQPLLVRRESVDTVQACDNEIARAFETGISLVRRSDYVVSRPLPNPADGAFDHANAAQEPGSSLSLESWIPLARGRQGDPVAVAVIARRYSDGQWSNVGRIAWLGRPSNGTPEEMAEAVLAHLYLRTRKSPPPPWLADSALPAHARALASVDDAQRTVDTAAAHLAERVEEAEYEGRWEPLLYADGPELEVVVSRALASFGADVATPADGGIEDLRMTTPDGETLYVVEVKGATGSLKVENLRQAADWRLRAVEAGFMDARSLVIANPMRRVDPAIRQADESFPHSCMAATGALQVVVISTRQIYEIIRRAQSGDAAAHDEFWTALASTTHGLVDLAEFTPGGGS
jgi:hypothetical protein